MSETEKLVSLGDKDSFSVVHPDALSEIMAIDTVTGILILLPAIKLRFMFPKRQLSKRLAIITYSRLKFLVAPEEFEKLTVESRFLVPEEKLQISKHEKTKNLKLGVLTPKHPVAWPEKDVLLLRHTSHRSHTPSDEEQNPLTLQIVGSNGQIEVLKLPPRSMWMPEVHCLAGCYLGPFCTCGPRGR